MYERVEKPKENKSRAVEISVAQRKLQKVEICRLGHSQPVDFQFKVKKIPRLQVIQRNFDRPEYRSFLTSRGMVDSDESKAKYLEYRDQGHSLIEHGPELSENTLKKRLAEGMQGVAGDWKSVRVSAKFNSYTTFMDTRNAAVQKVQKALENTIKALKYPIEVMKASSGSQGIPVVTNAIANLNPDCLPVFWDAPTKRIMLYETYIVSMPHYKDIGSGYEGDYNKRKSKEKINSDGSHVNIDVYNEAAQLELPLLQHTRTSFNLGDIPLPLDKSNIIVSNWRVGQHFPTKNIDEDIVYSHYHAPYRIFNEEPW